VLLVRWGAAESEATGGVVARLVDALAAAGIGRPVLGLASASGGPWAPTAYLPIDGAESAATIDIDALVVRLFDQEGASLVHLARLFVDDRNAAEDLVQEAFIRLARSAARIQDVSRAAAYLRSIVLNLARDHNRRGLVSLRHHLPFDDRVASVEDEIHLRDDQRQVIAALRDLPARQRACLALRYYQELGIDDIAATLGLSRNSVKTHLQRGLAAMERRLGDTRPAAPVAPVVAL
jgi:RNA polymerase sigma factor (sigma-70 family)